MSSSLTSSLGFSEQRPTEFPSRARLNRTQNRGGAPGGKGWIGGPSRSSQRGAMAPTVSSLASSSARDGHRHRWRTSGGALLPEAAVAQNLLNHLGLPWLDEGNDALGEPHLGQASGSVSYTCFMSAAHPLRNASSAVRSGWSGTKPRRRRTSVRQRPWHRSRTRPARKGALPSQQDWLVPIQGSW